MRKALAREEGFAEGRGDAELRGAEDQTLADEEGGCPEAEREDPEVESADQGDQQADQGARRWGFVSARVFRT